jgi:hypothetical protein
MPDAQGDTTLRNIGQTPGYPATGTTPPEGSRTPVDPEQAKHAASTAMEQGKDVIGEAREQLSSLTQQAQQQFQEQGTVQKERAATNLRQLGDQLTAMAEGTPTEPGMATDLVQQAGTRAHELAGWLDRRDPGALLEELRDLGRRKPGTFLLGALAAGVVAGRLTRGVVDEQRATANGSTTQSYGNDYGTSGVGNDYGAAGVGNDYGVSGLGNDPGVGGLR